MFVYQLRKQVIRDLPSSADVGDLLSIINDLQEEFQLQKSWNFYQKESSIVLIEPYEEGTVTVTEDSTAVTGAGTTWTSAMTGRRMKFGGQTVSYVFTFASTTTGTLDRAYVGDTESEKEYNIFQPNYDLPSDFNRILHLQNARTNRMLWSMPLRKQLDPASALYHSPHYHTHISPTTAEMYALWGQNGALRQIRLANSPLTADTLNLFYMRTTADVTAMDDSIDVPIGGEAIIKSGVIIRIFARRLLNAGDGAQGIATSIGVQEQKRSRALTKLWSRDVQESAVRRRNERRLV